MNEAATKSAYTELLGTIKARIIQAQHEALKAVNKELIALYWDIGQAIAERQKSEGWGKSIVEQLGRDLRVTFPGMAGFSSRNLWYMRNFYLEYCQNSKLQPLVAEISWSHNLVIMEKCKDNLQREFYIRMSRKYGWSKNVLINHVENQTYEKWVACLLLWAVNIAWKPKDMNFLLIFYFIIGNYSA